MNIVQSLQKNNGFILAMVLMMMLVLSILAICILNMNLGQTLIAEEQIKQVKANLLSKGGMAYLYANQKSASPSNNFTLPSETLDGVTYTTTITLDNTNSGLNDTNALNITTSY